MPQILLQVVLSRNLPKDKVSGLKLYGSTLKLSTSEKSYVVQYETVNHSHPRKPITYNATNMIKYSTIIQKSIWRIMFDKKLIYKSFQPVCHF